MCFGLCARLSKSVAEDQVCLFAVVDLRSSGSEPRSSAQFKDRGAMAITSRAARNTIAANLLPEGKPEDVLVCLATVAGDADVATCDDDDEPETDEEDNEEDNEEA